MAFFHDSADIYDRLRALSPQQPVFSFQKHTLRFTFPGKTSRGTLWTRDIWILKVSSALQPSVFGLGEAAPLPGLSKESPEEVEDALRLLCLDGQAWSQYLFDADRLPASVLFALEQALLDLHEGGRRILFPSKFTDGRDVISINGLIWMGTSEEMFKRIQEKLDLGFTCLKLKIGGLDWREEKYLLDTLRAHYPPEILEIRLDANGAYSSRQAMKILEELEPLGIHSIEQPIQPGQWDAMAELCAHSPIPIALDEELIGCRTSDDMEALMEEVLPAYLILKPTLLGGFQAGENWIRLAEMHGVDWWITSCLESNLGLNAIAQWAYTLQNPIPQGLGTGQVFSNNFPSPLHLDGPLLQMKPEQSWQLPVF